MSKFIDLSRNQVKEAQEDGHYSRWEENKGKENEEISDPVDFMDKHDATVLGGYEVKDTKSGRGEFKFVVTKTY